MRVTALDLDLEVFQGPFDLLLTLVLKEEVDLLEVDLAEVVVSYIDHLEQKGELDLEAATEFLVLIAALLLLKSQLMLPSEEVEFPELAPGEAAEELLARMLEYSRYRSAAEFMHERLAAESGFRYRSAPLPKELRRVSLDVAKQSYEPVQLAEAVGGLLRTPPPLDLRHMARPRVTVEMRLAHLRSILSTRARFSFDEAVKGADRLTEAMTVWALLELYKSGEAAWQQDENFGPITVTARSNELARIVEALLFLSSEPLTATEMAEACEVDEGEIVEALARLREHYAEGWRGVVLREISGGFTLATDPVAERAARRLLARPRTPPLTQAQAECLAIVAYLQPVSRPEIARIRGVNSESAVGTLLERGLIHESGRSQFGAVLYRTSELFEKLFGLAGLDQLPDVAAFDPSPEEEGTLRDRLLKAGEQRAAPAQS